MVEILVQQNGINYQLDLTGDEQFSINYSISDINDIGDSNGAYTKTINIPDTPNNRFTFGFATDMSVDLNYNYNNGGTFPFNPNKKTKCFVLEDTIVIVDGYIQFVKFTYDGVNNNKTIEVNIFADNVNFYNSLGDTFLTDLYFDEYNFTYSVANIKSTWNNNHDSYKKGYYFPLIDYGKGITLDDINDNDANRLTISDFKPAVFVKTIWDKIFATFSFQYTSNFLGGTNKYSVKPADLRFGNLVIPYASQQFQTGPLFNQDKIFHTGLTQTTVGQFTIDGLGIMFSTGVAGTPVLNVKPGLTANVWYDGWLSSPFQQSFFRNTETIPFSGTPEPFTFGQDLIIPFSNMASPMFNTFNSTGQPTYNTGPADPDFNYQNHSGSIFKQRFVLKTDMVSTVSMSPQSTGSGGFILDSPTQYQYVAFVNFYREFDPAAIVAGSPTTSGAWLGGTGYIIPPDLNLVYNPGVTSSPPTGYATWSGGQWSGQVAQDVLRHWICDYNKVSNVFDSGGTLIVPYGSDRYLGKYCTDNTGQFVLEPNGGVTSSGFYKNDSGNCAVRYYNDGYRWTAPGMYMSGSDEPGFNLPALGGPNWGDWYQQLNLQTIYLDGDSSNPLYGGATAAVMPWGNVPIQPGEKVRCVFNYGGRYKGCGATTSGGGSLVFTHIPPSAAFLLTYTHFNGDVPFPYGKYQNPISVNKPLTQFYNDVSPDYIEGQRVNFNDVIPKNIKVRDFVLDIVNRHNLYIEPSKDQPNNLIIEPRDDYYQLATYSLDWTNKIDLSTPIDIQVLAETQNKTTIFKDKDDKDWYNAQYTQTTNQTYGMEIYSIDNDYLTNTKTIESIFSPTPVVQLSSYFSDNSGDSLATFGGFIIPVFTSGTNQKPTSTEPANGTPQFNYRILYKQWLENQNSDKIDLLGSLTHSYPYAGPYDDPYNPSYSINWGTTLGEEFNADTSGVTNTLVNVYWATLLTELTDMDSKIVTVSMYLTPADINNFYFYKLVLLTIDGVDGYYKVNSIEDYFPGQNSVCTVTLLKSNVT